jgi:hypothetical protein
MDFASFFVDGSKKKKKKVKGKSNKSKIRVKPASTLGTAGSGRVGDETYPGVLGNIRFIEDEGYDLGKWHDKFYTIFQALAFDEKCSNAFKNAGLKTPNELIQSGFYLAPRPLLTDSKYNDILGITEATRQEANKSVAPAQTIMSQFTSLKKPIIIIAGDFFTGGYWKESSWHELIHAAGVGDNSTFGRKIASYVPLIGGLYPGNDLTGYEHYNKIYEACYPVLDRLKLP